MVIEWSSSNRTAWSPHFSDVATFQRRLCRSPCSPCPSRNRHEAKAQRRERRAVVANAKCLALHSRNTSRVAASARRCLDEESRRDGIEMMALRRANRKVRTQARSFPTIAARQPSGSRFTLKNAPTALLISRCQTARSSRGSPPARCWPLRAGMASRTHRGSRSASKVRDYRPPEPARSSRPISSHQRLEPVGKSSGRAGVVRHPYAGAS